MECLVPTRLSLGAKGLVRNVSGNDRVHHELKQVQNRVSDWSLGKKNEPTGTYSNSPVEIVWPRPHRHKYSPEEQHTCHPSACPNTSRTNFVQLRFCSDTSLQDQFPPSPRKHWDSLGDHCVQEGAKKLGRERQLLVDMRANRYLRIMNESGKNARELCQRIYVFREKKKG